MNNVKPKKSLGQHFLKDETIASRIADTLKDFRGLPVLEVGPGMGVLTKYLLAEGHEVKVAEIDSESVGYLKEHFPALADGPIIEGDFLEMDLNEVFPDRKMCVIGNYPYNISSQIFFHILDYKDRVECCSGMLQKEVAERLAATEGTKARGILSVFLQAWYDVSYLFTVEPHVFNPPPKVRSGVVKLVRNSRVDLGCDEKLFRTIVKTTFGQRRKTLRNSIRSLLPKEVTLPDIPVFALRPEQLSVARFIDLTNLISSLRNKTID
ncbi:MAG: 16S rRNA (adenine(1518)-N(6)/adenine(1519)-N(6))-dimethyltransferase RsmA [Paramuribaculum sp.]|nr:16S rRNA (adenine(1518)-N(6)/adenine(1519)-N(6))-dimethyltransferase RsmA [Paramuribaculum sp.]